MLPADLALARSPSGSPVTAGFDFRFGGGRALARCPAAPTRPGPCFRRATDGLEGRRAPGAPGSGYTAGRSGSQSLFFFASAASWWSVRFWPLVHERHRHLGHIDGHRQPGGRQTDHHADDQAQHQPAALLFHGCPGFTSSRRCAHTEHLQAIVQHLRRGSDQRQPGFFFTACRPPGCVQRRSSCGSRQPVLRR